MSWRLVFVVGILMALAGSAGFGVGSDGFGACVPTVPLVDAIELANRAIEPGEGGIEAGFEDHLEAAVGPVEGIVLLGRVPLRHERGELAAAGIELGTPLGSNVFEAMIDPGKDFLGHPLAYWVGARSPEDKIARHVWSEMLNPPAGRKSLRVVIVMEHGTTEADTRAALRSAKNVERHGLRSWLADVELSEVALLAEQAIVYRIDGAP